LGLSSGLGADWLIYCCDWKQAAGVVHHWLRPLPPIAHSSAERLAHATCRPPCLRRQPASKPASESDLETVTAATTTTQGCNKNGRRPDTCLPPARRASKREARVGRASKQEEGTKLPLTSSAGQVTNSGGNKWLLHDQLAGGHLIPFALKATGRSAWLGGRQVSRQVGRQAGRPARNSTSAGSPLVATQWSLRAQLRHHSRAAVGADNKQAGRARRRGAGGGSLAAGERARAMRAGHPSISGGPVSALDLLIGWRALS